MFVESFQTGYVVATRYLVAANFFLAMGAVCMNENACNTWRVSSVSPTQLRCAHNIMHGAHASEPHRKSVIGTPFMYSVNRRTAVSSSRNALRPYLHDLQIESTWQFILEGEFPCSESSNSALCFVDANV